MRVPDLGELRPAERAPTFDTVAHGLLNSLIHIADETVVKYRSAMRVALPYFENREVDQITWQHIAAMIKDLVERGYAGTYIRLIRHVVRLAFDHADVDPNPARHRLVKLPPDLREPVDPPTAAEIEAAFYKLEKRFRLPFLALESSGGRIRAVVNKSKKDNFDPATGLLLSRRTEMKKRVAHFNNLHPAVSRALEHHVAALPLECERLFPDIDSHSLREAIRKACKEAGVRHIKPHDLRHRRISLLHAQGKTWAEIGARVAQSSFSTTEKTYTHLMLETRELDYERLVRDC